MNIAHNKVTEIVGINRGLEPTKIPEGSIPSLNQDLSENHAPDILTSNARLPKSVFIERVRLMDESKRAKEHWFRRCIWKAADVIKENSLSKIVIKLGDVVADLTISTCKFITYVTFRKIFVPVANLLWNRHSAKVPQFFWNNIVSPILDLSLNNVEGLQSNLKENSILNFGKKISTALWDNLIAKSFIVAGKITASVVSKGLFLCMEGMLPATPMKAASFIENKFARATARIMYYGSYAAGLTGGVMWYAAGGGLGLVLTATFVLAPSLAAFANRAVMFCASSAKFEKPGFTGFKAWFSDKCNAPFIAMLKAEDAFTFKLIKDSKTGEPVDYYIGNATSQAREFLHKRLGFIHETESVAGLIEHSLEIAKNKQIKLGFEQRLTVAELYELTLKEYSKFEISTTSAKANGPSLCYPNSMPSIALNKELRKILENLNLADLREIKSSKKQLQYLNQLVDILAPKIIEHFKNNNKNLILDSFAIAEIRKLLVPVESATSEKQKIIIPKLDQRTWRPSLPGLLINLGRVVGGFANTAGAGITTIGHLVRALNQVFLAPEEVHKPLGLASLRSIKADLDQAINKASCGEEAFMQLIALTKTFLDTLEKGLRPFASALGQSTIDAIIMHTPFVAQNQMEAVNRQTDPRFIYRNAKVDQNQKLEADTFTPEYKAAALKIVDNFWLERGDEIVQDDFNIARDQRRWYHWLVASIIYPKRTALAINNSVGQLAAGDQDSQMLIDGLRIYFQQSLPDLLERGFGKLRLLLLEVESFLRKEGALGVNNKLSNK
jgi:hypothetical protein